MWDTPHRRAWRRQSRLPWTPRHGTHECPGCAATRAFLRARVCTHTSTHTPEASARAPGPLRVQAATKTHRLLEGSTAFHPGPPATGHSVWKTARPPTRRLSLGAAGQDEGPCTPTVPALLREARDGRHSHPSRGHAHPQALCKASMLLDKRGRRPTCWRWSCSCP